MNNTKNKILDASLRLFNKNGVEKITLRQIAKDLGISQGNLNYHFPKKSEIILSLYTDLVLSLDEKFSNLKKENLCLRDIFNNNIELIKCFYNYRFILLDFRQIMSDYPAIKKNYLWIQEKRKEQFLGLIEGLVQTKIIREEEYKGEYENVYIRLTIIGDFWMSYAEIRDELSGKSWMYDYSFYLLEILYPYLTSLGKEEFVSIMQDSNIENN